MEFVWPLFLLFLTAVVRNTVAEGPLCEMSTGYEYFIENIAEDHAVNTSLAFVEIYGDNTEIVLIQQPNLYFKFDAETRNVILVRRMSTDKGTDPIPELQIKCKILAAESTPLTLTVRVIVVDVNNNVPTFNTTHHTVSVPEVGHVTSTTERGRIKWNAYLDGIGSQICLKT